MTVELDGHGCAAPLNPGAARQEDMTKSFEISLKQLQPSQLYICAEKLAKVAESTRHAFAPVPVKQLGEKIVLTDGHTRAFAAFQAGLEAIPAYWETDELDWEAYEVCVDWCIQQGIHSIPDLKDRVVSKEDYKELWYKRCRAMHRELEEKRKSREDTTGGSS